MTRYAEGTSVPADRSRAEIERTLMRYGADRFAYGWEENHALIGFRMRGRSVRFLLPFPDASDSEFSRTPTGKKRAESETQRMYEQEVRRRWRALALAVKAKLEVVDSGIAQFEDEFLAYILIPGSGQTVGEWAKPELEARYDELGSPKMLELPREREPA